MNKKVTRPEVPMRVHGSWPGTRMLELMIWGDKAILDDGMFQTAAMKHYLLILRACHSLSFDVALSDFNSTLKELGRRR